MLTSVFFLIASWQGWRARPLAGGVPYRWGAYCGWVLFGVSAGLGQAMVEAGPKVSVLKLVFFAISTAAGVGLVSRRRYGVWAFFAAIPLGGIVQIGLFLPGNLAVLPIIAANVFVLSFVAYYSVPYYRTRWALLR